MNPVTVGIGAVAVAYGCFTAYRRQTNPASFHKLEPMKKLWGEKAGLRLHIFSYTIIPLLGGLLMIFAGLHGHAIVGP